MGNNTYDVNSMNYFKIWAETEAITAAREDIALATARAQAYATTMLSAIQCPDDVKQFGINHNIPNFAEMTWQAGFKAGLAYAMVGVDVNKTFELIKITSQNTEAFCSCSTKIVKIEPTEIIATCLNCEAETRVLR